MAGAWVPEDASGKGELNRMGKSMRWTHVAQWTAGPKSENMGWFGSVGGDRSGPCSAGPCRRWGDTARRPAMSVGEVRAA